MGRNASSPSAPALISYSSSKGRSMTPRRRLLAFLSVTIALFAAPRGAAAQGGDPSYFIGTSTIVTSDVETDCNFNGTAVPCPDYIWFIAVGKLTTPGVAPVTIYTLNQHIQFTANSINYDLAVPDGATTFDGPAATAATTFTPANTPSTLVSG